MSELEEKLGQVLANPQMMRQIMSLAQSLGEPPKEEAPREEPPTPPPPPPPPAIDPGMLQKLAGLAGNAGADPQQMALLRALEPYVSRERARKLEKAMRAARMATLASTFLNGRDSHV